MSKKSREKLYKECDALLKQFEVELLEDIQAANQEVNAVIEGDAGDMSKALEARHTAGIKKEKALRQLTEVRAALARIREGNYGLCEETGEEIQEKRLLAIPWTRYSVEGAELVERHNKKYSQTSMIDRGGEEPMSYSSSEDDS